MLEPSVRVQGPTGPQVVGAARALMRCVLALWDCDDLDDAGELLTSEIVSNAVRHAAGVLAMEFELSAAEGLVRVTVEDATSAPPVMRAHSLEASGGRGLLLVESLASRWGSNATDRGKAVWFEFPVHCRERPS
jgi:anti-sigma regulatory factor (Ser/Thr protein kinase)